MAGHSHWARIKRKKAVVDQRRGRLWSKLGRNITVAVRVGGGPDPEANPRLRLAIEKAKAANMPRDTIERAIRKGTGEEGGEAIEEIVYEGYGPGGVAILCYAMTDNRNRTGGEIRKIFERAGGNLGTTNCVAWMFQQKGVVQVDRAAASEERIFEAALEAGAEDVRTQDDVYEITCEPGNLEGLTAALREAGIEVQSADLNMVPLSTVSLDAATARKVLRLLDELDEHDDVQSVASNFDVSDEVMKEIEATSA